MNKIFKIIFNQTTNRLEVVSELAKSKGKSSSTDKRAEIGGLKASALSKAISGIFGSAALLASIQANAAFLTDGGTKYTGASSSSDNITYANGDDASIAVGGSSKAGAGSVSIGNLSQAIGRTGVAVGYQSNSRGAGVAIGNNAITGALDSIVIGNSSTWVEAINTRQNKKGVGNYNVVIGSYAKGAENSVAVCCRPRILRNSTTQNGKFKICEFPILGG